MKKTIVSLSVSAILVAAILFSCSKNSPTSSTGQTTMDLTVVGLWNGALGAIPYIHFNGEKIIAHFSGADSTFSLITRDVTRGDTLPIKDTTLVLLGTWRLNSPKDSVLLTCDTSRIIDTTLNILKPRAVRGQVVPVCIKDNNPAHSDPALKNEIKSNSSTGAINWQIAMTDFIPLAPLLNINIPDAQKPLLAAVILVLEKTSQ
jgi:hypothetical protein